uniref:Uncharacterized protein n=1 Tax=Ciona savignyi TaxID=51511 RepID=H2YHE5_CIOSA
MMGTTVLLFTNGKRTAIFDPIKNRHISDITACSEQTDGDSGFNQKLPEMKNAEVFASRNGTVYLLGGLEIDKSSNNASLMAKLYVLNLKSLQWTRKASLPSPRCMMGMGELNGEFFVTGGKELSTGNGLSTVFKYNFDDDIWISCTPLPTPVYGHGCASLKDRIYVLGGKTNEKKLSTDVYFLPTDTRQWCHAPSLLIPRFLAGSTVITSPHSPHTTHGATDTIYIVGGVGNEGLLTSIESYSPACDTGWNLFGEFPGGRCAQTVTSVNGDLCVVGGHVTERDDGDRYVSRAKFDVMLHDVTTQNEEISGNSWRKIVSHIRGIENGLFACADLKLDPAQIGR